MSAAGVLGHNQKSMAAVRCRLIVNPSAGVMLPPAPSPERIAQTLAEAGWQVDLVLSTGPGCTPRLAREAAEEGYDVVIAGGGDGTLNEALQGVVHTATALGVIPLGTANVFAREVGIPLDPIRAAELLTRCEVRRLDVGLTSTGRYFLLWSGIGFDAEVAKQAELRFKRQLGILAYIAAAVRTFFWFEGTRAHIELDGRKFRRRVLLMVVANTRLYALFPLSAHTRPDDGLFDVVLFGGRGFFTKLRHVFGFFSGRHLQLPKVLRFTARTVSIRSARPLPVQVDGELIGTTPMSFHIQPAALRILLPPTAPYGYPDGRFSPGTRAATAPDRSPS
mgnify:CR=1 FL=1